MKVVIKLRGEDPVWDRYVEVLGRYTDTSVVYDNELQAVSDADILITTNLSREVLEKFPKLHKIFLFKTGMDGLPMQELDERGISVRASHANADVIAEHALTLSLVLLHRTVEFHNDLTTGNWRADGGNFKWHSLSGMRAGILGFGTIGKRLYYKLEHLCADILTLNRSGRYPDGVKSAGSCKELVRLCDIIFVCLPKNRETVGLIDEGMLKEMKGKYLVNIGRADVCCERALYEALKSGILAGFASDVWYRNPSKTDAMSTVMPSDLPFHELKNVVMSPHCATHELDAHERYIKDTVEACLQYITEKRNL